MFSSFFRFKPLKFLGLITLCASTSACSEPKIVEPVCVIPMEQIAELPGLLEIVAKVHDQDYEFMVDTGANGLVIPLSHVEAVSGGTETFDSKLHHPDGTQVDSKRLSPVGISFAGCNDTYTLPRVRATDFSPAQVETIDGLLNPRDLLQDRGYVEVDFKLREIRLGVTDDAEEICVPTNDYWEIVPGYILKIEAPMGESVKAVIDTGASHTFLHENYADTSQPVVKHGKIRTMLGSRDAIEYENQTLKIGGNIWYSGPLVAADIVLPWESGAVIGQDLLSECTMRFCTKSASLACSR